ncbi:MAG TPA: HNH endonuclease signature motif containing protein [Flavobacteriales bacterium]|nr:HNH endonuclease signature motif containing protein [Flavobacteriales bacterium]HRE95246.1 HNH endonuclease signature motif containing protein [Flavobacteriales bacterium]HRJ37179.1 HNH endonuclease signature motif containing protein [Flavobacteriales bacterium]
MLKPSLLEIEYFETYYWANIISNVLRDPFNYNYLGSLETFFGENTERFSEPFPQTTRLHDYIGYMIDIIHEQDLNDLDIDSFKTGREFLWVEGAASFYGFEFDPFNEWLLEKGKQRKDIDEDDISEYIEEFRLSGPYFDILEKMSEEIFFIIFLNRELLQNFNLIVAKYINELAIDDMDTEYESYFKRQGVIARVLVPAWVQRAVFYRDRGTCNGCQKDISGALRIGNTENFDHIIPLEIGGINDVSNIQLLCEGCNKSKKASILEISKKYEKWY